MAFHEAAAGLVATALSELILTPLDAIKTLQQETAVQLGVFTAAQQLFGRNGMLGLYSGGAEFLVFNALGGGIKFGVYERCLAKLRKESQSDGRAVMLLGTYVAAALSFFASSLIMVPGELIKMRLQIGSYNSLGHGVRSIYASAGLPGFYEGFWAVCLREIPYTMLELGLYETTQACARCVRAKTVLNAVEKAVCATATGTATGWLTNPLDLVKTRLMAGSGDGSLVACFRSVRAQGGLFKGAGARATSMLISFPIYFALYDATLLWLQRRSVTRNPKEDHVDQV